MSVTRTSTLVDSFQQAGYIVVPDPIFDAGDFRRLGVIFEENVALYGEHNSDYMAQTQTHDRRLLDST